MRDPRWESDTLFLIFEEDFRFTEHDEGETVFVKPKEFQEVVNEREYEEQQERTRVPLDFKNTVASPPSAVFWGFFPKNMHSSTAVEPTATAVCGIACTHVYVFA